MLEPDARKRARPVLRGARRRKAPGLPDDPSAARLELNVLLEETLARYPSMEMDGTPVYAESPFINQLKTLPVRLGPTAR